MARSENFQPGREPFTVHSKHGLFSEASDVSGPFHFLNPTKAQFELAPKALQQLTEKDAGSDEGDSAPAIQNVPARVGYLWRSRDNRKGRHPLVVQPASAHKHDQAGVATPVPTSHPSIVLQTIGKMFTHYPVWDISWLVAYIFTWGSIVWCINGFFSFLPYIRPSSDFKNETLDAGGITAFIGAVLFFEVGSILLMFEAVNENSAGCFGWAVENLTGEAAFGNTRTTEQVRLLPSSKHCIHHHQNKTNLVGTSAPSTHSSVRPDNQNTKDGKTWQWFPSWQSLRDHYLHELGFLASFSQFCGATIFSIAGITALPGIINHMSQGLEDGIFWAPQIVGGSGFIISGTLYMLETQKNWYTPSFRVLGWHIAFWNLIGGIGFTLCGALGPAAADSGAQYQASCATFWGSFAFLIGSVLQLYEALQKNPVEEIKSN